MTGEDLVSGSVIRFPFLWGREAARGETEGRKPRPTVVGFRLPDNRLLLFPITTSPPAPGRFAREVPDAEKRMAGLDVASRCWIMLDEVNSDIIGKSRYIEPDCEIGRFGRAFTLLVFRAWASERISRRIILTPRND